MSYLNLFLLIFFHPYDCFDIIKRQRKSFKLLPILVLFFLIFFVRYSYIFFVNFPLSDKLPQDANVLLELGIVAVPLLTWVVSSYGLTSIMSGECEFTELLTASSLCLAPMIVLWPILGLLSNILSYTEVGIYNSLLYFAVLWTLILLFAALKRLNDFSFGKTLLVTLFSVITMVIIWAILLLIFSLTVQLAYFFNGLYNEINLKYFLNT